MVIKIDFRSHFFDYRISLHYTHDSDISSLYFVSIIMVEAIRYTTTPLQCEKNTIVQHIIFELTDTISRQTERLDLVQHYISSHLESIKAYESGIYDFKTLLQTLQPLQPIPNPDQHKTLDAFNAIVCIINSLNYSQQHEKILRQQCLRIQEILNPEKMSFAEKLDLREILPVS